MGNETSSPGCDAQDGTTSGSRRASQTAEALKPGETRRLPARLEQELLVGLAHEASATARGACVLLGDGDELIARLGPGALLAAQGVSLTYADGCEVFEVRLSSLAECVRKVVFAAAPEAGGDPASPCEAFVALPERQAAPEEGRRASGGCAGPRCAPEVEGTSGAPPGLQQLVRMHLELTPRGYTAHFVLSARSAAGTPFWMLEASGAPLQLPTVVTPPGTPRAGAPTPAAPAAELLPLPPPSPREAPVSGAEEGPGSVITTPVRLYEDLLQRVRASEQQNQRLSQALAEARDWNGGVADTVEAKEYELEVWRRQAMACVGASGTVAVAGLLEKGGWPLPDAGDRLLIDLHTKVRDKGGKDIVCPRGYELLPWTSDVDGYKCDSCSRRLPMGSVFYCCRPSAYDECATCYFGKLEQLRGAPASLRMPAALALDGGGKAVRAVDISMMIHNLASYKLPPGSKLRSELEAVVKGAIVSEAGSQGLTPERVSLDISPRSCAMCLKASVNPPAGSGVSQVAACLIENSGRLGSAVQDAVLSIADIERAATGAISVGDVSVQQAWELTARSEVPTTARSDQANAALGRAGGGRLSQGAGSRDNDASDSDSSEDSVPLPEDAEVVDIQVDLRRPTGVLFDGGLSVRAVRARSQGERLNIRTGYRVVSAGGQPVRSIGALQGRLEALRSRGEVGLMMRFVRPAGPAPTTGGPAGELDLDHASRADLAALQARGSEVRSIDPAGEADAQPPQPVECTLDVSQPLGLMIGDDLHVQHVQGGSQGEQQGIFHGWRVLSLQGEPVPSVQSMKERLAAERARPGSNKRIKVLFQPCDEDDSESDESNLSAV